MNTASENKAEVLAVIRAAARKLLFVRATEAAAVGAVSAALAVLTAQAGSLASRHSLAMGIAISLVPLTAVAAAFRRSGLRAAFRRGATEFRVVWFSLALATILGCLIITAGRAVPEPRILLPVLLLPLGAIFGLGFILAHGVTLAEAALYHDIRFGLSERLSTAAELSRSSGDTEIAGCVYAQALAVAADADIGHRSLWQRTRATVGSLVLAASLCAVLAMVSPPGSAQASADAFDEIRQRVRVLDPREKRQLVEALRNLARQVESDPALRRRLLAAAEAAQKQQNVDASLAELQEAVASADDAEAARIAREILRAVGLQAPGEPGGGPADRPAAVAGSTGSAIAVTQAAIDANSAEKPLAARTLVYNPLYDPSADANAAPATSSASAQPFVAYDDAWSKARARAAESMRTDTVPPQYRDLIRRFFELEQ